ncbi:MAG: hypothetical protein HOH14_12970 [Gammaproteobacteria bacterium]|jgi:hypothetical protein|nr:hypothetical protein [Gammaproteobacteria bacterium]MBT6044393.1 hypothetical protein [Gammaproteobacteria bacterium]
MHAKYTKFSGKALQKPSFLNRLLFLPVLMVLNIPVLTAQEVGLSSDSANPGRKRIEIVRTDLAPEIDGILDDEIWKSATVISDLHQFSPVDQGEPTERSEFYLAYSDSYFYVGARLYDSDPSGISARQLVQGQGMQFDDAFEFILDTFNNGRTGYQFQVNPNGIRREGVYDQPNNLNSDWSGIWLVESRIDDEGWTAEVAIPFITLNFDPTTEDWGFTIARTIARKREEIAWSSFNRNINPTTTGLITGIRDIRQGKGLDIIPSLAMATGENHVSGVSDNRVDPSLNVFYKITPNLTGAVTLNTDFSATEVDNRQVNLSRFSLFFPEKRDFFLQDVDIFSFGGLGGGGNFNNNQNGIPFYSRRIGLSSATGQPVDIDAGLKMTGRVGQWNVGALAVQQGDTPTLDGQSLFVGRAAVNVLSESSVGAIVTQGNPNSIIDNTLAGMDFRYQNTRFSRRYTMRGNAWYQQTDTDGLTGDDKAYGVRVNLDTQGNGFGGNVGYTYIGEDFNPALGFANQRGIESFSLMGRFRHFLVDHPLLRTYNIFGRFTQDRNLATGKLVSENLFTRFINLNTHRGDQIGLGVSRNREGLNKDFEIRPGIVIPAGKYSFTNLNAQIQVSNQRNFAPSIGINIGEFYDGDRSQFEFGMQWRPDEHFFLNLSYNYQDIELPQGDFTVRLVSANANYAFNSKWSWVNLVQYDNASSTVGINSRLRWNPQAGEDLFVVINYNFDSEGTFSQLSREKSEIALKYTKTFRF